MINLNQPLQTHKHMSSALFLESNLTSPVRRRTLSQKIEGSITSLMVVTVLLVAVISLVYLVHANRNATRGYAIKNLELERSRLLMENEVWDMEIAKVKALGSLEKDEKILSMIKAEKPQFIRGDTAVASR